MNLHKKATISPMWVGAGMAIALLALVIAFSRPAAAQPARGLSAGSSHHAVVTRDQALPEVVVQKNPGCECCELWAKHLRANGFKVRLQENPQMAAYKLKVGVPLDEGSCHTGLVGGLFVEGHIPADAIKAALLHPEGMRGLVLPGMPGGSPGMATPPDGAKPYTVGRVDADGATHPFRTYTP